MCMSAEKELTNFLTPIAVRNLQDKQYEKRKLGAAEIER